MSPPPASPAEATVDILHGIRVPDPYRWLEDPADDRTRNWVRSQNRHADQHLRHLAGLDWFRQVLDATAKPPADIRRCGQQEFRAGPDGRIEVRTEGRDAFHTVLGPVRHATLSRWAASVDGTWLAAQHVHSGAEGRTPLRVVRVADGTPVGEPDPGTRHSALLWWDDQRLLLAHQADDIDDTGVVLRTVDGSEPDIPIFRLPDRGMRYHLRLWHHRWLVISARLGTARHNRLVMADLDDLPRIRIHAVQPEPTASTSAIVSPDGGLVLLTTADAPRGRVAAARPENAASRVWTPLVDASDDAVLAGVAFAGDNRLVVVRRSPSKAVITLHAASDGSEVATVAPPGAGTIDVVDDPGVDSCRFVYRDWVTPAQLWRLGDDGTSLSLVEGGVPDRSVITVRTHVPHDAVDVPLTLLHREGHSGPAPTLILGYGGFGVTMRPAFQPEVLAWVRAGGVVAIAGLRGGGEGGTAWHDAGRGPNKTNTIADLHAVTDWLVGHGWAGYQQIALLGASNAGLVMAAAAVARPRHYRALVAVAPLADMVRYERSGLGPRWRDEYGSAADPAQLAALLSYSPYHNVRPDDDGPAVLLVAGATDTRVDPLHARKLCARLQNDAGGRRPILLRTLADTGHQGASGDEGRDVVATALAFLAHHMSSPSRAHRWPWEGSSPDPEQPDS